MPNPNYQQVDVSVSKVTLSTMYQASSTVYWYKYMYVMFAHVTTIIAHCIGWPQEPTDMDISFIVSIQSLHEKISKKEI